MEKKRMIREKGNVPPKEERRSPRFVGATEGLGIFDCANHRLDASVFNESRRKLLDYANINFDRAGDIVEFEKRHKIREPPMPRIIEAERTVEAEKAVEAGKTKKATAPPKASGRSLRNNQKQQEEVEADEEEEEEEENDTPEEIVRLNRINFARYEKQILRHDEECSKAQYNEHKLYGVIMGQLTPAMIHKLKEDDRYNIYHEQRDALKLWLEVKRLSLEDRAPPGANIFKRIEDARRIFNGIRQGFHESIGEFYDRFVTEVSAAELCGVKFGSQAIISEEDGDDFEEYRERELAMIFINKVDKKRYGNILDEWSNRAGDGEDIYPTSVTEALRRFSYRQESAPRSFGHHVAFTTQSESKPVFKCFFCEQPGHKKSDCPKLKEAYQMFEKKKKNEKQHSINTTQSNNNDKVEHSKQPKNNDSVERYGFVTVIDNVSAVFATINNKENQDFDILADNQANVSIFNNSIFLNNIRDISPIIIRGIGGGLRVTQIGQFEDFGEVYYHPDAPANVLCFNDLRKKYKVDYDQYNDCFLVNTGKTVITFSQKNKLYVFNPKEQCFVTTVSEMKQYYSKTELDRAEKAHKLFIRLGRPSLSSYQEMIKNNKILNCPVTTKDIENWINIEGKDLGTVKGRTTREKPKRVEPLTKINPYNHNNITLYMDVFFVEGVTFLISISNTHKSRYSKKKKFFLLNNFRKLN